MGAAYRTAAPLIADSRLKLIPHPSGWRQLGEPDLQPVRALDAQSVPPERMNDPDWNRTSDLRFRKPPLYPSELRGRHKNSCEEESFYMPKN